MQEFEKHSKSVILHYFLHLEFCAKLLCKHYNEESLLDFLPKQVPKRGTITESGIELGYWFHGSGGDFELSGKELHFSRSIAPLGKNYNLSGVYSFWKPDATPQEEYGFLEKSRELGVIIRSFPPETLPASAAAIPGYGGYIAPWVPVLFAGSIIMK